MTHDEMMEFEIKVVTTVLWIVRVACVMAVAGYVYGRWVV